MGHKKIKNSKSRQIITWLYVHLQYPIRKYYGRRQHIWYPLRLPISPLRPETDKTGLKFGDRRYWSNHVGGWPAGHPLLKMEEKCPEGFRHE